MDNVVRPMRGRMEYSWPTPSRNLPSIAVGTVMALLCAALLATHSSLIVRTDKHLAVLFNALANRSWVLDRVAGFLSLNVLAKGLPVMMVFFYAWFDSQEAADAEKTAEKRQILLYTLLISVPAVVFARALAWELPYRARPITNPDLHLRTAYGFDPGVLLHWSSFPSDHATLFFLLATGVYLVSSRAGALLYLHALLIVVLPRLYLGVHYLSDILVGAALGCAIAYLANWHLMRSFVTRPALRLQQYSPGIFYALLFFLAAETAELYEHVRDTAVAGSQIAHVIAHHLH